jgi:diacylglycerol kinase family enzyme
MEFSRTIEEAKQFVRRAADDGFDTLWMGGGDGTVNVLLNAAFEFNPQLNLGVVPLGTVNALARALQIPRDPIRAAKYLLRATPVPMDVGSVNGIYFLCFASIGFDAAVVHDVPGLVKSRYGRMAYVYSGLRALTKMERIQRFSAQFDPADDCVTDLPVEGGGPRTQQGYSLILSNICNYAGYNIFRRVQPCSGNMELYLFQRNAALPMLGWIARQAIAPARYAGASVGHYMITSMDVSSGSPLYLQVDGEAVVLDSQSNFQFQCHPAAARILTAP